MNALRRIFAPALVCQMLALTALLVNPSGVSALEPIPDKLVVLTFDDSVASQFTVVRPLLKEYRFGATFFITEGFGFATNKTDYMTWEQIAQLHREGFEIGDHTRDRLKELAAVRVRFGYRRLTILL